MLDICGYDRGSVHWTAWLLRGLLLAGVAAHLMIGNQRGALVAGVGFALALLPVALMRLSGQYVPRTLDLTFALAMALQYLSESFRLFDLIGIWDKLVHFIEIALATSLALFLLLGYRRLRRLDVPEASLWVGAALVGVALGTGWEIVEFIQGFLAAANLQLSNVDTMTDLIADMAGAVCGAVVAVWLYRHTTIDGEREQFGRIAVWLAEHLLAGVGITLLLGALLGAAWLINRLPLPL